MIEGGGYGRLMSPLFSLQPQLFGPSVVQADSLVSLAAVGTLCDLDLVTTSGDTEETIRTVST